MRAFDDDDLVDRGAPDALEDEWKEESLLRCAEAGRLTGGEHDRRHARAHELSSTVTLRMTTASVGR